MKRYFLIPVILMLLTASCAVAHVANRPWAYGDLRRLDPPDDAPTPAADLLAVYTRTAGYDLQIRLDLLDLTFADDYLLEIQLWDNALYAQAPLVIQIPSSGRIQLIQPPGADSPLQVRVTRDPGLDTITISINRFFIGERYWFDIRTYGSHISGYHYSLSSSTPADEALDIHSDDPPPLPRAPLLLAFTDSYPAYTPAQALRRWDGAHTGPTGERHGLRHVLDNAERYGIPVALLDLKTPASLSALDFMGKTGQIQRLVNERLLILPDVAYGSPTSGYHYGEPADVSLTFSREAAQAFGLPASLFIYAPFWDLLPAYRYRFIELPDSTHLARRAGQTLIPLPTLADGQATVDGLSLNVRRRLIQTALSPDPGDIVVLGGSLPNSTWGDADMAAASFAYIAAHPWIQPLDGDSLLVQHVSHTPQPVPPPPQPAPFPIYTTSGVPTGLDSVALQARLLAELGSASKNPLTDSAGQMYFALTAPGADTALQALRAQYLGGVGILLAASRWAETPYSFSACASDLDYDGQDECLLASSKFFAVLETDGARLTFLFSRDESGAHQLIAPSAQFALGLSDPSEWKPARGEAADPAQIMGAFSDASEPFAAYTPTWTPDGALTLTAAAINRVKTFRLTEDGLQVRYDSRTPLTTRIPIAVDPWQRFRAGWVADVRASLTPTSWGWGLFGGIRLEVRTEAPFSAQGFNVSIPFLSQAENPNLDYPAGHFYPFPLSVMVIHANGNFIVEIISQ
jgi:hypothetical protein